MEIEIEPREGKKEIIEDTICGSLAAMGAGFLVGGIEGFFSSYAMPTNIRTLSKKIPHEIDKDFGNESANRKYLDKVVMFTYHAVKYPTRLICNYAILDGAINDLYRGHYVDSAILLTTNLISAGYELHQLKKNIANSKQNKQA